MQTIMQDSRKDICFAPTILYTIAIPTNAPPPTRRDILPPLIDPKDRRSDHEQRDEVEKGESLGLKDALQDRQIDDHELAHQAAGDGVVKHVVAEKTDFAAEDGLGLGATGQGVEHVEEHEAGEGHGGVARGDEAVERHLADVDHHCAEHDDGGGREDALEKRAGEDSGVARARGSGHYGWVDRLDA